MANISGTPGNDTLYGSAGAVNDVIQGLDGNDIIIGFAGNDQLFGGAGDDTLQGTEGEDALYDTINGGVGQDLLTGGTGGDAFVFDAGFGQGVDHIADFHRKEGDRIYFDDAVFGKLKEGSLKKSSFEIGDKADGKKARVIYDKEDGVVRYDDDGSGKHKAKIVAILDDGADLKVGDFIVI